MTCRSCPAQRASWAGVSDGPICYRCLIAKLTGFPGTETAPDWTAALEQIALLRGLEKGTVTSVLTALKISAYTCILEVSNNVSPALFDGTDGAPRYLCFWHNDQFWLQILGTYTARQWIANTLGVVAQSNFPLTTQSFQSAWLSMAQNIYTNLIAAIGNAQNPQVNISGHSLGGAVAYNVAILLRANNPFWPVRLMTFGSPRPCRGEYLGTLPSFHYDVQTLADNAVYLPPNLPLAPGAKWMLQGNPSVVKEDGTLAAADANAGELVINKVPEWGVYPHQLYAYFKFLLAKADKGAIPPSVTDLLIALDLIPGKQIPQEMLPPPQFAVPEFTERPRPGPSRAATVAKC